MTPATRTRAAATIGTFDGVHIGHRLLVSTTREIADQLGLRDVVVTFDRHPFATIRPQATPKLLTTQEEKIELLEALGVDEVVVLEFDEARSHQEPERFIEDLLVGELGVGVVVVGDGFRFGHRARGDAAMLEEMGEQLGFSVVTLRLVGDETGGVVSSSHIRELIAEADFEEAAQLLGRAFEVRGELLTTGPTTFRVPDELLLPPAGEYAVELVQDGRALAATATVAKWAAAEARTVGLVASDAVTTPGAGALRFHARVGAPLLGADLDR